MIIDISGPLITDILDFCTDWLVYNFMINAHLIAKYYIHHPAKQCTNTCKTIKPYTKGCHTIQNGYHKQYPTPIRYHRTQSIINSSF